MKTLANKRLKMSSRVYEAALAPAKANRSSAWEVVGDEVASHEQDWRAGTLLAHLAILIGLLVVLRGGVLTAYLIEHVGPLGAGFVLYVLSARRLGTTILAAGSCTGLMVLVFWGFMRMAGSH